MTFADRSVNAKDSQALVLDAGHISVESNLADKEQLKEIQSKRGRQYDEDDFKQLEGLMYDRLSLQLEATQVRATETSALIISYSWAPRSKPVYQ